MAASPMHTILVPVLLLAVLLPATTPSAAGPPECQTEVESFDRCLGDVISEFHGASALFLDGDTLVTEQRTSIARVCVYARGPSGFEITQTIFGVDPNNIYAVLHAYDGDDLIISRFLRSGRDELVAYRRVGEVFAEHSRLPLESVSVPSLSQGRFITSDGEVWRFDGAWGLEQVLGSGSHGFSVIDGETVFLRNSTAIEIFEYDETAGQFILVQTLEFAPDNAPLEIELDGARAYVGPPVPNGPAEGIYERSNGTWSKVADIAPPDDGVALFDNAVLEGDVLCLTKASASQATCPAGITLGWVYRRQPDGTWREDARLGNADGFGTGPQHRTREWTLDGGTLLMSRKCPGAPPECESLIHVYDVTDGPCGPLTIAGNGATLDFIPDASFEGVSTDGGTVLGSTLDPDDPKAEPVGALWTPTAGIVTVPPLDGDTTGALRAGSCAVETYAGTSGDGVVTRGFVRAGGTTNVIDPFGDCEGALVALHALSGDGSIAAGSSTENAGGCVVPIRWQFVAAQLPLGPSGLGGEALGISGDGAVTVGYVTTATDTRAVRWDDPESNPEVLGAGAARDASYDGAVVVGSTAAGQAFRWTLNGGLTAIGDGDALAVSDDGTTIGGRSAGAAFLWREDIGVVDLAAHVASFGIDASALALHEVTAISADGRVLVGPATCGGNTGSFVLRIDAPSADTDEDGLLDVWEEECGGIDGDGDGARDLVLFTQGARPWRKNLFIEVDAMTGRPFSQASVDLVEGAFGIAPVANPDGSFGIDIHILRDETDLPFAETWEGVNMVAFDALKLAHFGRPGDSEAVKLARAKAYRYCIVANRTNPSVGGLGELGGNDFYLCAGSVANDEGRAAVFMHELGHNLGLRHGGDDDVQGKPNYPSVMNYTSTYRYAWNRTFWRLDYAGSDDEPEISCGPGFGVLDEDNLDETAGIGTPGGRFRGYRMPYGVTVAGDRFLKYARLDGSFNDFGDSEGTLSPDGVFETSDVVQDLNYLGPDSLITGTQSPTPDQSLFCRNDWATLQYEVQAQGDGPYDGDGGAELPDEITDEAVAWIEATFPIPPCLADFDGNGAVDFADLLEILSAWGTANQEKDLDGSGVVDFADLLAVLSDWGVCAR